MENEPSFCYVLPVFVVEGCHCDSINQNFFICNMSTFGESNETKLI